MWSFPAPYPLFYCMLLLCIGVTSGEDKRTVLQRMKECIKPVSSCEHFRERVQKLARSYGEDDDITAYLLELPYPQQCYVLVKSPMGAILSENVCSKAIFGGYLPVFTTHNMAEAAAVWNMAGTNDGLWTAVARPVKTKKYVSFCVNRKPQLIVFDEIDFLWAKNEPSVPTELAASTYINGSTPTKLYDVEYAWNNPMYQFVCVAWVKHTRNISMEPPTSSSTSQSQSQGLHQDSKNTSDSPDSADLTVVWVVIGLLIPIFLLTIIFIVYKKVKAKQDSKNKDMERTAKPMHTKRHIELERGFSASSDAALPQMRRNLLGRLHSNAPVSESSEVKSEGVPAVLGPHSTTASASGVHMSRQYDVHEISRVDPNRGKWDEAIDGQSSTSAGRTFPFSLNP